MFSLHVNKIRNGIRIMKTKTSVPVNPYRKSIDKLAKTYADQKPKLIDDQFLANWNYCLNSLMVTDVKNTYDKVSEACDNARSKSDWNKLLHEYTGGLSEPSKMPCYGWSTPAHFCRTGSKLHAIDGTTCKGCYALKGRYIFGNVRHAMARRYATYRFSGGSIWNTFRLVLSRFLNWNLENHSQGIDPGYFRWFDSGDISDYGQFCEICEIARDCPDIRFWLPTREQQVIYSGSHHIPNNLTVRFSSTLVDTLSRRDNSTMVASSLSVIPDNCSACPATATDRHKCDDHDCRNCWFPGHIAYMKH